ncbi:hypothetical protein [Epilithonimonas sp. UC225_85]|uniref:hypothetical protein n=1 Tax=Epilithonimonas sp. UC225_85 TaxID=3350167 RepID=UPI0036D2D7B5
MLIEIWNKKLKESINDLIRGYQSSSKSILTEGDLENLLFFYCKTKKLPVHSQITWFKSDRKSGYEVDLTIIDEEKLLVEEFDEINKLYYNFEYPHKGYFYDGEIIGIEIKFIRKGLGLKSKVLCDLKKLKERLIPHKKQNISNGIYKISNLENIKFHVIIGFKQISLLNTAKKHIEEYLSLNYEFNNLLEITLFCPTKIEKL